MSKIGLENPSGRKAYIITGPTSGIGLATAFEVAKHGTVVLVGRDGGKLSKVQRAIDQKGGRAVSVVGDLSDMVSVRHAAAKIVDLHLPLAGLVNNSGIYQMRPTGFNPGTALGRDANLFLRFLGKYVLTLFAPFVKYWSTPKRAACVITRVLLNESGRTGVYYDDEGHPMQGSMLVRDPKFTARIVAETRSLLATVPA